MQFKITGKPLRVSREFVRAWLHASYCVLSYHKQDPDCDCIKVEVKQRVYGGNAGCWHGDTDTIELDNSQDAEDMAATILHEMIHAMCGGFGADVEEACTSTLCARLKADVEHIASCLLEGTYKRAAYLAHTKLSYRNGEECNPEESAVIGVRDKYAK